MATGHAEVRRDGQLPIVLLRFSMRKVPEVREWNLGSTSCKN